MHFFRWRRGRNFFISPGRQMPWIRLISFNLLETLREKCRRPAIDPYTPLLQTRSFVLGCIRYETVFRIKYRLKIKSFRSVLTTNQKHRSDMCLTDLIIIIINHVVYIVIFPEYDVFSCNVRLIMSVVHVRMKTSGFQTFTDRSSRSYASYYTGKTRNAIIAARAFTDEIRSGWQRGYLPTTSAKAEKTNDSQLRFPVEQERRRVSSNKKQKKNTFAAVWCSARTRVGGAVEKCSCSSLQHVRPRWTLSSALDFVVRARYVPRAKLQKPHLCRHYHRLPYAGNAINPSESPSIVRVESRRGVPHESRLFLRGACMYTPAERILLKERLTERNNCYTPCTYTYTYITGIRQTGLEGETHSPNRMRHLFGQQLSGFVVVRRFFRLGLARAPVELFVNVNPFASVRFEDRHDRSGTRE